MKSPPSVLDQETEDMSQTFLFRVSDFASGTCWTVLQSTIQITTVAVTLYNINQVIAMISRRVIQLISRQSQARTLANASLSMKEIAPFAASRLTPGTSSLSPRWFSSSSTEEKKESEEARAAGEESVGEDKGKEEGPSTEEILQGEIKALKDQLLRSYAEQENTRNIARRDVVEARQFAIKSFAKSLLEVSDNLQRALDSVPVGDLGSNAQLKLLHEGIEMTNVGLLKALEANGVKKYCEAPGDKFNPSLHNALMQYPDPTKEPDTVGQVIKVGFTLNDRVLRPAEVGVVKKP